ncbi:MAG: VanZ family protein [Firmicutes bacterium]|nr:VanZ family protein [Bacillota bacterium]
MTGQRIFKQILLWGPVLIQMGLITYFSSQPAGSDVLKSFPLPAKVGHLCGYALLALLLYRASNGHLQGWNNRAAVVAFLISLIYGSFDEYYQSYIPGRGSSLVDVAIDGAGALLSLGIFRLWLEVRKYLRLENRQGEKDEI